MRYLFGFLCVCALGLVPLVGCSDDAPGGCQSNAECDDGNQCTRDLCDPATGTCDNFGYCDCPPCTDDNPCTTEVCDFSTGMCSNRLLDDGTPCRHGAGTCQAGVCVGLCDPASDDILQCPLETLEHLFCCPGREDCDVDCDVEAFEVQP